MADKLKSNAPGKGEFQATVREIVLLQQAAESAQSAVRNRFKRAKSEGHDIKVMQEVINLRRMDPDVVKQQMETRLRYLTWSGIDMGQQLEMFDERPTVDGLTEKERAEAAVFEVEQAGYAAGRANGNIDAHQWPAGSELAASFTQGWHRGQAAIAMEMAPPDKAVKVAAGRKRRGGNPEDAPAAEPETEAAEAGQAGHGEASVH